MSRTTPSVHLGFCHDGRPHTDFMLSVLAWERYEVATNGRLPGYSATKDLYVAQNRNRLVREFLKADARPEWLWILDPDIMFPPDTLAKLQQVADPEGAQIVAGAYWFYQDGEPCLTWHADTDEGLRLFRQLPNMPDRAIVLGSCGMGCTLIHRSVFETLAEIYKDHPWTWFGHDPIRTSEGREFAGEDVTFCRRARKAGFTVVGHCGVVVEHLKVQQVRHGGSSGEAR